MICPFYPPGRPGSRRDWRHNAAAAFAAEVAARACAAAACGGLPGRAVVVAAPGRPGSQSWRDALRD